MRSKKQPKVHTYKKSKHGRQIVGPGRTLLSICFTFLVAGGIGVVGYSIAKPVLEFIGSDTVEQSVQSTTEITASKNDMTVEESSSVVTESTTTIFTDEATQQEQIVWGVRLSTEALANIETLSDALESARDLAPDGTILVIPLKIAGGAILYQTDVSLASQCGAAQGTLTLEEIVTAVTEAGWTPVAECSLLYDNLLPDADAQAGYVIADSGSRWLDNKKENGGLPWVSPFSDVTVQYLTDLTQEIAAGGFVQIWCTDVIFPSFLETDLAYIGSIVQDVDRGQTLVNLVNTLTDAAGTVPVLLEVNGADVMEGTEEVYDSDTLEVYGVVLDIGTEVTVETMLNWVEQETSNLNYWIMADTSVSTEITSITDDEKKVLGWIMYDAESST